MERELTNHIKALLGVRVRCLIGADPQRTPWARTRGLVLDNGSYQA